MPSLQFHCRKGAEERYHPPKKNRRGQLGPKGRFTGGGGCDARNTNFCIFPRKLVKAREISPSFRFNGSARNGKMAWVNGGGAVCMHDPRVRQNVVFLMSLPHFTGSSTYLASLIQISQGFHVSQVIWVYHILSSLESVSQRKIIVVNEAASSI